MLYKLYLWMVILTFSIYKLTGSTKHMIPSGGSLETPSLEHFLGTDDLGIDIFAQICHGGGSSLIIGAASAALAVSIGVGVGVLSGYIGGKADAVLMGICDIVTSMPQMILLILMGAFLGSSYITLVIVLALMSWTHTARIIRARVLFIKSENYIRYSENIGASVWNILIKHFLPSLKELLGLSFIKIMSRSIVMEASLAYLGISNPISKSWGMMLNRAMSFSGIFYTPFWKWWVLSPLIALVGLILSLMLLGREKEGYIIRSNRSVRNEKNS